MPVSDRTSAGVVLMGMALAAGWWYWRLTPDQRQTALARTKGVPPPGSREELPPASGADLKAAGGPPPFDAAAAVGKLTP